MKNQIIGIMGCKCFIGQNLTNYSVKKMFYVFVVGRKNDKLKISTAKINGVEVDFPNPHKLYKNLKECDTIIWSVSSLIPSILKDPLISEFNNNTNPMIRLLELLKSNFKTFDYLSSGGTVYSVLLGNKLFLEDGLSKIVVENYIKFLVSRGHFQSFILRPSTVSKSSKTARNYWICI